MIECIFSGSIKAGSADAMRAVYMARDRRDHLRRGVSLTDRDGDAAKVGFFTLKREQ